MHRIGRRRIERPTIGQWPQATDRGILDEGCAVIKNKGRIEPRRVNPQEERSEQSCAENVRQPPGDGPTRSARRGLIGGCACHGSGGRWCSNLQVAQMAARERLTFRVPFYARLEARRRRRGRNDSGKRLAASLGRHDPRIARNPAAKSGPTEGASCAGPPLPGTSRGRLHRALPRPDACDLRTRGRCWPWLRSTGRQNRAARRA